MRLSGIHLVLALSLAAASCGQATGPAMAPQALRPAGSSTDVESQSVQTALSKEDIAGVTDHPLAEPGTAGDGFDTPPDDSVQTECLWPTPPPGDLANFGTIDDHLFRGARPTDKGFQMLADQGVTEVVDLENGSQEIEWERQEVISHKMAFISLPMGVILPPSTSQVDAFFKIVEDPSHPTVYFHCMQGRDRTGTMAFCYRIKLDGWATSKAYAEMKQFGFHTFLLGLNAFVHWYGYTYDTSGD